LAFPILKLWMGQKDILNLKANKHRLKRLPNNFLISLLY